MERVTGIGGVFFRAEDPEALVAWYAEHLGVPVSETGTSSSPRAATHVWAPFAEDTDYWPAGKQAMVNFTVADLDAMLAQLRARRDRGRREGRGDGGIGRFGWAVDPEGNRFELWEPADLARRSAGSLVEGVTQHRLLRGTHLVEPPHGPPVRCLLQQSPVTPPPRARSRCIASTKSSSRSFGSVSVGSIISASGTTSGK